MTLYNVSQVPVMERGRLVGLIDETDILLAVAGNDKGFGIPTRAVMTEKLVTLQARQSLQDLLAIFARGLVGCIYDQEQFLGLVTPVDFLNYLRKRTAKG